MLSLRLQTIASFLSKEDKVADIGADHGYLGIYAVQNHLVESIILTDIKASALASAKKNIARFKLDIPLQVTAGLKDIDTTKLNTLVISGMGTNTILNILSDKNKLRPINKLILQSNNNLEELRRGLTALGYQLLDEITVNDNGFWYVVCCFKKSNEASLDEKTYKYGLLKKDKIPYYEFLLLNDQNILEEIIKNNSSVKVKDELQNEISELTKLLEECRRIK